MKSRNANPVTGKRKPYGPEETSAGRKLYDAEVFYTDRALGELLELFAAEGLLADTLIVVVADHGECLGEHGYFFGHWDVFEETARVPMLLVHPDGRWRDRVVETTVGTVDLLPTTLSLLGLPVPEGLDGRSLIPLLDGAESGPRYAYTEQVEYFPVRSLRLGSWLLIERGELESAGQEWFRRDPASGELRETSSPPAEIRDAMTRRFGAIARPAESAPSVGVEVPGSTAEQLRALGYVE